MFRSWNVERVAERKGAIAQGIFSTIFCRNEFQLPLATSDGALDDVEHIDSWNLTAMWFGDRMRPAKTHIVSLW